MKILAFHCQRFDYKLDHPTPVAQFDVEVKEATYQNALIVMVTIENVDRENKINAAAKEIRKLTRKANANLIVINPFSHLSTNLASAEDALHLLKLLVLRLQKTADVKVIYTSFGWYKSFMLDVYGHNSSQVFREF